MKVKLEEFRTESTHLKNQHGTIRRLEERNRQLEQQMEDKIKEIVEIKQWSFAEENQKILEVLIEREQMLQDQLRQAQDSVFNMQKLHELAQSQMFEVRAQSEEEKTTKQSEVNLLMDEVERAQTRLLSLEMEKVKFIIYAVLLPCCCSQVQLSEKSSLLEKADGEIREFAEKVNEQKRLIQKLEDDILKVSINELRSSLPWNSLMDRMMIELHLQGKTCEDIKECLKRTLMHPQVAVAIKSAHALG